MFSMGKGSEIMIEVGDDERVIFIIGLIYGINNNNKECIDAFKLFDRKMKRVYIQSFEKTAKEFMEGRKIVGLRLKEKEKLHEDGNLESLKYPVLSLMNYDCRELPLLNGKGEVIKPGKEIVIGKIRTVDRTRYAILNANEADVDFRFASKEEVIQEELLGTIRDAILKPSDDFVNIV